jgi:hypothetical protein
MPRYYFNLYQGSQLISEDGAGYDCPSDDAARQFARMSHGFVALDPVLSSPSGNYRFVVLNEDRQNIFTMSISQGVSPAAASSGVSLLS